MNEIGKNLVNAADKLVDNDPTFFENSDAAMPTIRLHKPPKELKVLTLILGLNLEQWGTFPDLTDEACQRAAEAITAGPEFGLDDLYVWAQKFEDSDKPKAQARYL